MSVSEDQVGLKEIDFKWPYSWIKAVHNWLKGIMEKNLKDPALALLKSMVIGDRGTLPHEVRGEFSKTKDLPIY